MYIAQQAIPARAHIALSQGEHKSAEELLHHRLGEHPGEAQSHYLLGQSYVQQGKIHEAILQYKRALALCGENDQLRANCTQALIDLRVLPDPENPQQISAQNIRFHKNGQSLRTTIISPNQDKDDKEDSTQDNEANSALATTSSKQVQ
jgi:predicted Zn-dependent protease